MESEAIKVIFDLCLQNSEIEATTPKAIGEKEVCLSFLADIWKLKPEFVQSI